MSRPLMSPDAMPFARWASAIVFCVGALVLAGWWLDLPTLTSLTPSGAKMVALTALAFILAAVSLWLLARGTPAAGGSATPAVQWSVARACAALVALIGLLGFGTRLLGWNVRLDNFSIEKLPIAGIASAGSMSAATALALIASGSALLLARTSQFVRLYQACAIVALLIGWLGLSRYVYGGEPLVPYASMAIHTAALLLILGAGILSVRRDVGLMSLLVTRRPVGSSLRLLLPAAILVPLIAGVLALQAERIGWVGTQAALSLFALTSVVVLAALVWINASLLDRADEQRERAQSALGASEQRTSAILEAALDAVISMDKAGVITGWSAQAQSLFGWRREEAIGRSLAMTIIPERYREAHRAGLQRYLETGEARVLNRRIELSALHRDQHEFPVEIAITPIRSGDEAAFSAFVRDITERQRASEALQESQQLLQAIIDNSMAVIYVKDLAGRYLLVNRRFEDIFHLAREAILGRTDHDLFPREAADAFRRMDRQAAEASQAITAEETAPHHDGPHTYVSVKAPLRDQQGGIYATFGISTDITERKSAEDILRESEARLRTLAESLPHLVWTCRSDGWCDYLSRQWVEYTGRPEAEQLGYGWAEHLHPDDRERAGGEWAAAVSRGDSFETEFRIRRADGAYRWFKTRAVPLKDGAGHIVKWFGSNTDFEDSKRSEERLRAQLERLNLLDQTTRAIGERQDLRSIFRVVMHRLEDQLAIDFGCACLYDTAEQTLAVACIGARSQSLASALGLVEHSRIAVDQNGLSRCMRGELVHETDTRASAFPLPTRLAAAGLHCVVLAPLLVESNVFGVMIAARREAGSFTSAECEFLRQLSQHVALAAHQAQLYTALQGAYEDLRQSQQMILQQERLRALTLMASGIAHDINNALSPAALYAQSLLERDPSLSAHARDYLIIIQRAIEDVSNTVARMREFYRPREVELALAPVDVNQVLQQALDLTRARWSDMPQERGIVIRAELDLDRNLPAIMGAENEIRDALTNLILNAVDAMPEGGTLTLRSRMDARAGTRHRALIDVSDSGVGMSEAIRSHCLEPFFTTKGERGTGLGLAMVYGMIQRHSGELEIESEPGVGTTVRLAFPIRDSIVEGQAEPKALALPPLRLLVIDDDPLLLESMQATLTHDGHDITTAEGGQAGIDAFVAARERSERFFAVITDLGMPNVDGRTVAAKIKSVAPDMPVIMLTGWGHRLRADELPLHVDRVLSKPPKLAELRSVLADIARGNQSKS
jgi:PAS domain S-box-containing protein